MIALLQTLALLLLFAPAAMAQDYIIKDSLYFTMDDGIQSPEEMEEEAEYVYGQCTGNTYQSLYFDCKCLSGAFLQAREKAGPTALQNDILTRLTKTRGAVCPNTANVAGQAYNDCLSYSKQMRELATDNEQYCACAANKTANDFAKQPRLNIQYIRGLKSRAMVYCRRPENRAPTK